jgi:amino acid adenylation domain-containing protein
VSPHPAVVHTLVAESAARYPERIAVEDPRGAITYAELDRRANALAARLADLGVRHSDRVVLWADKSCSVVTAMQAVLRLGAAYVPLDGTTPVSRAAFIARDCAATAMCCPGSRMHEIAAEVGPGTSYVNLEEDLPGEAAPIYREVAPDDPAYILYTSGSTGSPKGVCISHRNARAFVDWTVDELMPTPDDRFSNHAPFSFDLSVLDIYTAFSAGASVHLIPAELAYAPEQLANFVREHQISVWYSVPSALTLMMRQGGLLSCPSLTLRAVLFAGEPFPVTDLRQLAAWTRARLLNLYGPTETNVCTFHEVTTADLERDQPVPIGVACSGDMVWIDGQSQEGELFVDGPTVMLGYWGQPRHSGPYPTGDIVRLRPDGAFDYVGRRDHMVKVRGHRIELGEVEAVLVAHPEVRGAAAVVTGSGLDARVEAFIVAELGKRPGVLSLKKHSAERLPPYMIPDTFHYIPELPRTYNGKVDRRTLIEIADDSRRSDHANELLEEKV